MKTMRLLGVDVCCATEEDALKLEGRVRALIEDHNEARESSERLETVGGFLKAVNIEGDSTVQLRSLETGEVLTEITKESYQDAIVVYGDRPLVDMFGTIGLNTWE